MIVGQSLGVPVSVPLSRCLYVCLLIALAALVVWLTSAPVDEPPVEPTAAGDTSEGPEAGPVRPWPRVFAPHPDGADTELWSQLAALAEDPDDPTDFVWPPGLRERLGTDVQLLAAAWPIHQELGPRGAVAYELRAPQQAIRVLPDGEERHARILLRLKHPLLPPSHRAYVLVVRGRLTAFTDDTYDFDFVLEAERARLWFLAADGTWTRDERRARVRWTWEPADPDGNEPGSKPR